MSVTVKNVKRLAAKILNVGETRIWMDPQQMDRVEAAITREDVKRLIEDGVIRKIPPATPSRGRWRKRRIQRKKGRGRGPGSRKGPRVEEKELWITRIRSQRRYLKTLKEKMLLDASTYRRIRRLIKGGMFRSVSHLRSYLLDSGLLRTKVN